jgi:hypothetical protein
MRQDFAFTFLNEQRVDKDGLTKGQIRIGDFAELFEASLLYWSVEDYKKQWRQGLSRLLFEQKQSCLITSMYDPSDANFIFWWVLYPEGDTVYIQNHLLFLDQLDTAFSLSKLYDYIYPRETINEDGRKISEWSISTEAIRAFYVTLEASSKRDD